MMISRTSAAHTIVSIEPYESGQDRPEPATSPCMTLTICFDTFRSTRPFTQSNWHQTRRRQQLATKLQRRLLSATAVFRAGPILQQTAHFHSKRIATLPRKYIHDACSDAMVQD